MVIYKYMSQAFTNICTLFPMWPHFGKRNSSHVQPQTEVHTSQVTTFHMVAHNIHRSSVWSLLHVTLLMPIILKWHLDFWKICAHLTTELRLQSHYKHAAWSLASSGLNRWLWEAGDCPYSTSQVQC
jgi:hypothetical protein